MSLNYIAILFDVNAKTLYTKNNLQFYVLVTIFCRFNFVLPVGFGFNRRLPSTCNYVLKWIGNIYLFNKNLLHSSF